MTIKGTLETFNLRELLQMLSFNQKVGTLVLQTEQGAQTIYMDHGRATFVEGDELVSETYARIMKRRGTFDTDRIHRAEEIFRRSGRFVGDIAFEMGLADKQARDSLYEQAMAERLFDIQLAAIKRFEFRDGEAISPNDEPARPIEPALHVESLLLDLTRKIDHWQAIAQIIPTANEVFEGTDVAVDLGAHEEVDIEDAKLVVAGIDGYKSLTQVATVSNVDLFTVAQVTAALFEAGGIRPVPTEDLLVRAEHLMAQAETEHALPLLKRSIERGDAAPAVRMRVADALEVLGRPLEAAAELETFAALSDDGEAPTVFLALQRAFVLRDGDIPSAARLCDYYLRHRPWLREHHIDASAALRRLIDESAGAGRAGEAASRLAAFIENGDAPSEDLLLLADLYIAEGRSQEAAAVLLRRAEDLLVSGRAAPARELLRRVLDLDSTRGDARRRLIAIDGAARKRRQRRRVVFLMVLFLLIVVAAGAAWWTYNQEAGRAVRHARVSATKALDTAEGQARDLLVAFQARIDRERHAEVAPTDLAEAAENLKKAVRALVEDAQPSMSRYASELENHAASGHGDSHRVILRGIEHRQSSIMDRTLDTIEKVSQEAERAINKGEAANGNGKFKQARKALVTARNLALSNAKLRERAKLLLRYVDEYFDKFKARQADMIAARERDGTPAGYRSGMRTIIEMLDSDLTRDLRLPVDVDSEPQGAQVLLNGVLTGQRTPCTVEYTPFVENARVELRFPGRESAMHVLPTWSSIQDEPEVALHWKPMVLSSMPAGPRFSVAPELGRYVWLWTQDGLPIVLRDDGRTLEGVDPESGAKSPPVLLEGANSLRMSCVLRGGSHWQLRGHRSLVVQPPQGEQWVAHTTGELVFPPTLANGIVVICDQRGIVYGLEARKGKEKWRQEISGTPSQQPYRSALGVLLATRSGSAFTCDARTGKIEALAPDAQGAATAVPFGDGALFLGGGENGCRRIDAQRAVHAVGNAHPVEGPAPFLSADGVAWIEDDGVRWLGVKSIGTPRRVDALGDEVAHIGGEGTALYAVGADSVLRAVDDPADVTPLFALPLGGEVESRPLPLGRNVYVLVGGRLLAIER